MVERLPLVLISGELKQLPTGDTIPSSGTSLQVSDEGASAVAAASALNFVGPEVTVTDVGGVATVTSNTNNHVGAWTAINDVTSTFNGVADSVAYIEQTGSEENSFLTTPLELGGVFDIRTTLVSDLPADSFASMGIVLKDSTTGKQVAFAAVYSGTYYTYYFDGPVFNNRVDTGVIHSIPKVAETIRLRVVGDGTDVKFYHYTAGAWVLVVTESLASWVPAVSDWGIYSTAAGVTAGVLTKIQLIDYDISYPQEAQSTSVVLDANTDHVITSSEMNGQTFVRMSNAALNTVTVNSGLTVTEPVTIIQGGAGTTTFVAGAGVTLLSAGGGVAITSQYAAATLVPTGTADEYFLIGAI